ncbi:MULTISPECIES: Tat pathway signal sequence domain protein [unclassified Arcicella]|uniref:exo-rhamnogalacturonan lyase family protein n=1 Tax=unclassified Arcicella TaxID=2644986 RepID=UPI0028596FDA|nr:MULTISPECIES: Tat pathway signal sequence domain protein [unclassified Arcicella]MDR6562458.1 hypothetical protein [Arcicella sp. BE51]MDR6812191.1 hypothetical protein [Arcicella sp. BE140]MDR6823522.1 hypothetical protein [Arcicella sp. BE139]
MKSPFSFTRRAFVKKSMIATAGLPLASSFANSQDKKSIIIAPNTVPLSWLDTQYSSLFKGTTFGIPWPKGQLKKGTELTLVSNENIIPTQTWPLAYWPDGSLKWTAHAISKNEKLSEKIQLKIGKSSKLATSLAIEDSAESIKIDTGKIQCEISKNGQTLITSLKSAEKEIGQNGKLVLSVQDKVEGGESFSIDTFEGKINKVIVEQSGAIRAVVKIEGTHENAQKKSILPFVVRLYFYAEAESIRMLHTIIYDGDENKDFIKGLGIRFSVPLNEPLYDRHIRFVGENKGVFAEAVQGLSGLRRDAGRVALDAQIGGKTVTQIPDNVLKNIQYIPAFGDYTLFQGTPDAFDIQKRTKTGYSWVQSAYGGRASGTGYLGTPKGGLAFGIRNFWQSYPAQIDIKNAYTALGEVTLWLWAPKAPAMDLRAYHDGMGEDTYEKQLNALDITYEDYEPEFGRPFGVARTSELQIWALAETPSNEMLTDIAQQIQEPPLLVATPEYLAGVGIFGSAFSLPDKTSPKKQAIENQLDFHFDYYKKQIDQRRWYGFWNFGDVMHSYDQDRHVWKYDVGGFAWDNSELSTDLWLWYYFLRTGRSDVFRMAEAMTRHTGEVDVHHIGRFSPLGSRHNVQHWGCSAKQLRISTAANRRFYYYLTADERVGDLMREQVNADRTLRTIIPGRKIGQKAPLSDPKGEYASVSFGTDWGALSAAWLTEWERTENPQMKAKLLNSMRTIAEQAHGFFAGGAIMELSTGKYQQEDAKKISVSHLSAVFGLAEICAELIDVVDMSIFEKAWLQYCQLYNGTAEEQKAVLGESLKKLNLEQGHARLTAFAAKRNKDPELGKRAWKEFYAGEGGIRKPSTQITKLAGPKVLNPIDEGVGISTNSVAQWGLAAMQCLAFASKELE